MAAFATPASAEDDADYWILISGKNVTYYGDYGIYAKPGEKLVAKAKTVAYTENGESTVNGVTYKWCANSKLKAKINGNKLTVAKLPKVGKYRFSVSAYDKSGTLLQKQAYTIKVKKKPGAKIVLRNPSNNRTMKIAKKGKPVFIELKNASFGWDNNKKKSFCAITVKSLKTGKTAVFNPKTGKFSKNSFIAAEDAPGGSGQPSIWASFSKAGKYKVTMTIFHSDKKLAVATQTVTVK